MKRLTFVLGLSMSPTLLETYDQTGRCGFGRCTYFTHEIPCACQNGACTSPPHPLCKDPFTLPTYTAQGACSPGSCNYAIADAHCAFGCDSGACKPDPCAGVTCDTPPPDSCSADPSIKLTTYPGYCSAGRATTLSRPSIAQATHNAWARAYVQCARATSDVGRPVARAALGSARILGRLRSACSASRTPTAAAPPPSATW